VGQKKSQATCLTFALNSARYDASTSVVIGRAKFELGSAELACGHLARLVVAFEFVADLLTFYDFAHASALNSGDVYEHIGIAVVRLNEAEALSGIEPFNCTSSHNEPLSKDIKIPDIRMHIGCGSDF
jgi:hypothetical protein